VTMREFVERCAPSDGREHQSIQGCAFPSGTDSWQDGGKSSTLETTIAVDVEAGARVGRPDVQSPVRVVRPSCTRDLRVRAGVWPDDRASERSVGASMAEGHSYRRRDTWQSWQVSAVGYGFDEVMKTPGQVANEVERSCGAEGW